MDGATLASSSNSFTTCTSFNVAPVICASLTASLSPLSAVELPSTGTRILSYMGHLRIEADCSGADQDSRLHPVRATRNSADLLRSSRTQVTVEVQPTLGLFHEATELMQPSGGSAADSIASDEFHFSGIDARGARGDDLEPEPFLFGFEVNRSRSPGRVPGVQQVRFITEDKC